jgi:mono/diheme cytochrome c family protein
MRMRGSAQFVLLASCVLSLVVCGCQQKMAEQPSYRPLESTKFFADGRASRPKVPGTVARGSLKWRDATARTDPSQTTDTLENYRSELPFPLTMAVLQRGQERFTIFCSVCHGLTGEGDGSVVRRGYTKPPSLANDNSRGLAARGIKRPLRDVPIGYFFEVATQGYGAMADYSSQVPIEDRWAIAAYIRALQTSQLVSIDSLPGAEQERARRASEVQP